MYEYTDGRGELVTVRSIRTLERLLAEAAIKHDTPFRAVGEAAFVSASTHPVVDQLATQLGLPFATRPVVAAEPVAPEVPTPVPAPVPPPSAAEVSLAPAPFVHPSAPPTPQPALRAPSPWRVTPQPVPAARPLSGPGGRASGAKLAVAGLLWQAGAVVGGLIAFLAVGAALGGTPGAIAGLVATCLLAREGGRRLRRANPTAGSAYIHASAALFMLLCTLGGIGAFVAAAIVATTLVFSWKRARPRPT